jgi:hypothetical protein
VAIEAIAQRLWPGREIRISLLDEEHVAPAGLGKVIGDAHPRDAAAYDDDARMVNHKVSVPVRTRS